MPLLQKGREEDEEEAEDNPETDTDYGGDLSVVLPFAKKPKIVRGA